MKIRHIKSLIVQSLQDFPAVLINGARQVGKSTLAKSLLKDGVVNNYISLDDLDTLNAAKSDPQGFINQFHGPVAIDEIQRAPDLLLTLKKAIDSDRTPGRFLLTGSANLLSYPGVLDSLAGRIDLITVEGLSLAEYFDQPTPSTFLTDIFEIQSAPDLAKKINLDLQTKPSFGKKQLNDLVVYGSFPEVSLKHSAHFRERWYSAYQTAYLERDVHDLSRLLDVVHFSKFYKLIYLQTGNLVNMNDLASSLGIDGRTVSRYLEILEMTFQTTLLQPWFSNVRKTLIKTPKVYAQDTGHVCSILNIHSEETLERSPHYGSILETWAFGELRKLMTLTTNVGRNFYRTHAGKEVDFLLNKGTQYCGIECKAASTISPSDFRGLRDMQEAMGEETLGIILYNGEKAIPFANNIAAVPFRALI